MAATVISEAGIPVEIFEKKRGPGKKLLIAGRSGLNITYDAPLSEFPAFYGASAERLQPILHSFPPEKWIQFIHDLKLETFIGTSRRVFLKRWKASPLLRLWLDRLKKSGAVIHYQSECKDFNVDHVQQKPVIELVFADGRKRQFAAACFALGGGSYEGKEEPLRWPGMFQSKGLAFRDFEASNVGFEVAWPEAFLKEAEGLPLKNIELTTALGKRKGDLVVTRYGLEGTPVYSIGAVGDVSLDLKPDLSEEKLLEKLSAMTGNLSSFRRLQKGLKLGPASLALLFHLTSPEEKADLTRLVALVKKFPLRFECKRPLDEAISSAGGLGWEELNAHLMLNRFPGIFAAGEMLDWDAPTGGFLIQACVSLGFAAGQGVIRYLDSGS